MNRHANNQVQQTILITGSTDGIGLETAKQLYSKGHQVLLHGRNPSKLEAAEKAILALQGNSPHRTTTRLIQGNPHRWYVLSRRS